MTGTSVLVPSQRLTFYYRNAQPSDLGTCYSIESASYPSDEAATLHKLQVRQSQAKAFFRLCCVNSSKSSPKEEDGDDTRTCIHANSLQNYTGAKDEVIVGFICGTLCREFTEESMSEHDEAGVLLAIHSVVVREEYRRRGIATDMMMNYISCMRRDHLQVKKLVLIAKQHLMRFYVNCGFRALGLSAIVHGSDPWFDHELNLDEQRCYNKHDKPKGERFWIVDSFADQYGAGNPAGVVLLENGKGKQRNQSWMQIVAREFNLSETAFIQKISTDDNMDIPHYRIRFFSPTVEVDLCGHATLASAATLFEKMYAEDRCIKTIYFHTKNNVKIEVSKSDKSEIIMVFPWKEMTIFDERTEIEEVTSILSKGLGIYHKDVLYLGIGSDKEDILVEVTEECFRSLNNEKFDMNALVSSSMYTRGIIVCCRNSDKSVETDEDFRSRFFGPKAGIPEDPVTGSAHCLLAPYFGRLLGIKKLIGRQTSMRGGIVTCELNENPNNKSVTIIGSVLFASEGYLNIE